MAFTPIGCTIAQYMTSVYGEGNEIAKQTRRISRALLTYPDHLLSLNS